MECGRVCESEPNNLRLALQLVFVIIGDGILIPSIELDLNILHAQVNPGNKSAKPPRIHTLPQANLHVPPVTKQPAKQKPKIPPSPHRAIPPTLNNKQHAHLANAILNLIMHNHNSK
jgi:hypothetical protein